MSHAPELITVGSTVSTGYAKGQDAPFTALQHRVVGAVITSLHRRPRKYREVRSDSLKLTHSPVSM